MFATYEAGAALSAFGDLLTPEARAEFAITADTVEHYLETGEFHMERSEHLANLALVPTVDEARTRIGSTFLEPAPTRPRARSREHVGTAAVALLMLVSVIAVGILGLTG